MQCRNNDIKELLAAYAAGTLTGGDLARTEEHLRACADCAQEADLLRMMANDPAPDPGDAFWAEMPGRVYRAVQQAKTEQRHVWYDPFRGIFASHWAWAAAAASLVLIISWFIASPMLRRNAGPSGDEYAYDDNSGRDPALRHTSSAIAEMTSPELDAVDSWAVAALSSLADEVGSSLENTSDADISEELADLDSPEVDRFSNMLNELEEG